MEALDPQGLLTLDFRDPAGCARRVVEFAKATPIAAAVGVDEDTVVAAAAIAEALGLPHNPLEAVAAARDKKRHAGAPGAGRRALAVATAFSRSPADRRARRAEVGYPCVLKPTFLSGESGSDPRRRPRRSSEPHGAASRRSWRSAGCRSSAASASDEILVEDFVAGAEVALEGLLTRGELRTLALFDKPDPLDGPVLRGDDLRDALAPPGSGAGGPPRGDGPRRAGAGSARRSRSTPSCAGTRTGRGSSRSPRARSAGSAPARCSFGAGMSLEELVLRHALGREIPGPAPGVAAAGVMMIPIPKAGVLEEVARARSGARGSGDRRRHDHRAPGPAARAAARGLALPGLPLLASRGSGRAPRPRLREAHARLEFQDHDRRAEPSRTEASRHPEERERPTDPELAAPRSISGSLAALGMTEHAFAARTRAVTLPGRSRDCGRRRGRSCRGSRRRSGRGCGSPSRCPASA